MSTPSTNGTTPPQSAEEARQRKLDRLKEQNEQLQETVVQLQEQNRQLEQQYEHLTERIEQLEQETEFRRRVKRCNRSDAEERKLTILEYTRKKAATRSDGGPPKTVVDAEEIEQALHFPEDVSRSNLLYYMEEAAAIAPPGIDANYGAGKLRLAISKSFEAQGGESA